MQENRVTRGARLALPLAAVLAGAMLAPGLAAAQDEPQYAGLDKDLSGVTIRMAAIGGGQYEAMYDSIKEFEEQTGATVEIVFKGDGFEIDRYLRTNYGAGTIDFDVAWNHTSFMSQYTEFVEPLQSYFTPEELAVFSQPIIQSATIDGNLQLIPRHADISALHYRTDLYGDADLQAAYQTEFGEELAPPETLDQLKQQAEFFVKQDSIKYGTQFAGKDEALTGRFYELLFANGGDYFDADMKPIFDSEAGVAAATWMQDLYAKGVVPSDTPNLLWDGVAANFCNGDVAVYLEWYGWYSYFQDPEACPNVAGKFGLGRGPVGSADVHTGWAGAHAFSVTKASQNKEAAVELIKFLTSERVAYEEAQRGFLPVRSDVWEGIQADADSSDVQLDKDRMALAELQVSQDFRTPPLFADWISFSNSWFPTLQGIILGDMTVQDGLAKGVGDSQALLDELGY